MSLQFSMYDPTQCWTSSCSDRIKLCSSIQSWRLVGRESGGSPVFRRFIVLILHCKIFFNAIHVIFTVSIRNQNCNPLSCWRFSRLLGYSCRLQHHITNHPIGTFNQLEGKRLFRMCLRYMQKFMISFCLKIINTIWRSLLRIEPSSLQCWPKNMHINLKSSYLSSLILLINGSVHGPEQTILDIAFHIK